MFAIIMAGGSGTRFWPASRERLPKQFLKITGNRTMLEETLARSRLIASESDTYVVVNSAHEEPTRRILGRSRTQVLVEPVGRNTAACIGLAAVHIRQRDEDTPIIAMPADHYIADAEGFALTLKAAAKVACSGAVVTLGVTPTRPETGYGYIELGEEKGCATARSDDGRPYFLVERFVEKPDYGSALRYLSSGRHLWNSGIFVFTARTILGEIACHMPRLLQGLEEVAGAIGTPRYETVLDEVYPGFDSISIDYGVMEKTQAPVCVLRADFGWSDVGSWQSLYELRRRELDGEGNLLLGDTVVVDARRNLVYSESGRLVTLLGVEGLAVVDTPDALMIADLNRSQEVKKCPELLKKNGREGIC